MPQDGDGIFLSLPGTEAMLKDLMIDGQKVGQVNVPDGRRIEHRKPKLGEEFIDATEPESGVKTASFSFSTNHHFVLVPIPPSLVPLGPEDVVPGKTLLRNKTRWLKSASVAVNAIGVDHLSVVAASPTDALDDDTRFAKLLRLSYATMQQEPYEYSNDHGVTWQPCSKPASPA